MSPVDIEAVEAELPDAAPVEAETIAALVAEVRELRAQVEALTKALAEHQWSGDSGGNIWSEAVCPACGGSPYRDRSNHGHRPDCVIAAALTPSAKGAP